MIYLFSGTDRNKAREALERVIANTTGTIVRVTDAHTPADISAALGGSGLFGGVRVVVLDSLFSSREGESKEVLVRELPGMKESTDTFLIFEGALDAATRKLLEKFAHTSERFDVVKVAEDKTIFKLADALQTGDKKALWVGLMREYAKGSAPEAVHGLLFWGAKQMCTRNDSARARLLVAALAELPHEARRRGEDMSYALERFVLSSV
ncbi:MAG: hypothetical protein RLZZ342_619 [Candidatus Parcubacteria bacterium]|jgi:DNA polymerase III delta subunit